ncbi:MAG: putative aromatic acid decarboxylase [Pelotomaculum sp. PtaB.Bin104]|nr:MAG: putative aromatic acid decarboxylase [Pelotomaculum sp. PtaB.Bin104]
MKLIIISLETTSSKDSQLVLQITKADLTKIEGVVQDMDVQRIIVSITGATGAIYGVRLLEALQECPGVETHLILSSWAEKTIALETKSHR